MLKFLQQLQQHFDAKLPFVAYRKPNETVVNAIFQTDDTVNYVQDFTETGFVFSPFLSIEKTVLIPLEKQIKATYKQLPSQKQKISEKTSTKNTHIDLVQKGIDALQTGTYQKIVLSRKIELKLLSANPIVLFQQLLALYPTAFVYVWYHPKVGCWLGATPETLLQTRGNTFKTMSLAGTQPNQDNVIWSTKEQEEQQMVTNFIADCLLQQKISFTVNEPYTIKAGNLAHIRTDISGRLTTHKLMDIIAILHPTPAVCGLPKEKAKQFILDNEGYDRQFYTGFLGELNFEATRRNNRRNTENHAYNFTTKTSNLFVNLRCMQLQEKSVLVYVGGGITALSNAEAEYQETEHKAKIMQAIFDVEC